VTGSGSGSQHHSDDRIDSDVIPTQSVLSLRQNFTPKLYSHLADHVESHPEVNRVRDGLFSTRKTSSEKQSGEPTPVKGLKREKGSDCGQWHGGVSKDGTKADFRARRADE
jgi:hypothetical protein